MLITDNTIVIIYHEKDDRSISKKLGWVSQFKTFLESILHQLIGQKITFLLKKHTKTLSPDELDHAQYCILIMSHHLIHDENVFDILKKINQVNNLQQKCMVLKSKVSPNQPSHNWDSISKYNMYPLDIMDENDFFTPEAEQYYWTKMLDLAYDICHKTATKDNLYAGKIGRSATIFLAETDYELSVKRSIIKRELERYNCKILPENTLPTQNQQQLKEAIKKDLEVSDFSIHFIGGIVNQEIKSTEESLIAIQNQLAAEQNNRETSRNKKLFRFIWMAANTKDIIDEAQKSFVESIKTHIEENDKVEISNTSFEEFKYMVINKIFLELNNEKKPKNEKKGEIIYLIYDPVDKTMVSPYIEIIQQAGFTIITPLTKGSFTKVREHHICNLCQFDVVIIFKNQVNDQWVHMKVLDILKSPGIGRNKPILGKAIVSPKVNINKFVDLQDENFTLIFNDENTLMKRVKSFLNTLPNPSIQK